MLTQIQHVKVGSIVRVKGVDYKVSRNSITNLVLNKKIGIAYDEYSTSTKVLLGGATNHNTLVEVMDVYSNPVKPASSVLTEQLRKQVSQKSLTDSLREQVKSEQSWTEVFDDEDEDDEEDWDDDDEDEDEDDEECNCEYCRPDYHEEEAVTCEPTPFIDTELEEVKQSALRASLRSQSAEQQANQARLDNKIAVSQLGKRLDIHERAHNALADVFEREVFSQQTVNNSLSTGIRETREYAYAVSDVAHNALQKVEAIESKQKQEALKVNLQDQLNRSLAQKKATAELQAQLNNQTTNKTTGGNGTMKNLFGAFKNQFGKVEGQFAFSIVTNGLALRKGISQEFVAYNKDTKELTDVSGLTLKFDVPAFKLPVKEDAIAVGDLIIHNGEYVYVTGKADGYLETLNPAKAVRSSVIPTKNALLGAAFYTVVKTLDAAGQGGFNPMLLMALNKGEDKKDLLPLLLMSGGLGGGTTTGAIDPTMLMMLGDDVEDLLPLVLMQQGGVAGQGFNPLMFLAMNKGGSKMNDLLPLLMMQGQAGGQAGGINPMLLMALSEGGGDMKELFLMQALTGQNLFGGQAPAAPAVGTQSTKGNK